MPEPDLELPDRLRITLADGPAFLAALDRDGPGRYTVQVPGTDRMLRAPIGGQVSVELEFFDTKRTFRHLARVVAHDSGPPEIATFEFLPEESEVRELIVCHAEGELVPYLNRRAERRAVWLPVEVHVAAVWRHGLVTELSELGAFVAMADPPAQPSDVVIRIAVETGALEIPGRVVFTRALPPVGCAIEFVFADRAHEVQIRAVLAEALQRKNRT